MQTVAAILTSSAVTAGLVQLCTWAVRFVGERQVRNATTAQQLVATAADAADLYKEDNQRLRDRVDVLDRKVMRIRSWLQEVLLALGRVEPNDQTYLRVKSEYEQYTE